MTAGGDTTAVARTTAARIVRLDAPAAAARRADLTAVLVDAVADGASVGFLAPLDPAAADAVWRTVERDVLAGACLLLGAVMGDRLVGTVQLRPAPQENARHRAEVCRLIVHRDARGRGIGRALLAAAEAEALALGRTLLVLDTDAGSAARRLYEAAGWTLAGEIPGYATRTDGAGPAATALFWKLLP